MTTEPGDDERPYTTDDPTWTDTWAWIACDVEHRSGFLAHVLAKPYSRKTRQSLLICRDGRAWRKDVITDDNLSSPLLSIEMEGWKSATLRSPEEDMELFTEQWDPPMDFGKADGGDHLKASHIEQGIKAHGRIGGQDFSGVGFRDRGFGPRHALPLAAHLVGIFAAPEADWLATLTLGLPMSMTLDQDYPIMIGYVLKDGVQRVLERDEVHLLRNHDGSLGGAEIAGVTFKVTDNFGEGTYTAGWDPEVPLGPSPRQAYRTWLSFLEGQSPEVGRMSIMFEDARVV
jgi:hypothetical protein